MQPRARFLAVVMAALLLLPLTACTVVPLSASAAQMAAVPATTTPPPYHRSTCGVVKKHRAMLSLDDYPYSKTSRFDTVPELLKAQGLGMVTFLLTEPFGTKAKADARVDALRATGMYVANHTYDHANLTKLTNAQVRSELKRGVKSNLVRPPGGATNKRVNGLIKEYGDQYGTTFGGHTCLWVIDTLDWQRFKGADGKMHRRSAKSIRARIYNGMVAADGKPVMILGHWHTNYATAAVLGNVKAVAAQAGYKMCRRFGDTTGEEIPNPMYC